MFKRLFLIIVTLLVSGTVMGQTMSRLDPYNPEYVEGTVLIKFVESSDVTTQKRATETDAMSSIRNQLNLNLTEVKQLFPRAVPSFGRTFKDHTGAEHTPGDLRMIYRLKFDDPRDAKEVAEEISQLPEVEFAEPDYLVYAMEGITSNPGRVSSPGPRPTATTPNDPLYSEQWYLGTFPGVNAEAAWDSTTGDTTQIIAIIDTGVDWDHPDLDDNIWTNWDEIPGNSTDDDANGYVDDIRGWDFVNDDNNPNDDNSHGTHVAGIAAAEGNNGVGTVSYTHLRAHET